MKKNLHLTSIIPADLAGKRLDQVLSRLFPAHSRSRIQEWIRNGDVLLNGHPTRQRYITCGGENIEIVTSFEPVQDWQAENIPLEIIHEDEHIIIINKPVGLVVHPGAGNPAHTLSNALLHYDPDLQLVPRAGIVHRLDKDTSGIMIIARTPESHTKLVDELQKRKVSRVYQAIVVGVMTAGGTVDLPVGRHPRKRIQMAVTDNGKEAVTHYRVIKKFRAHTHIRINLETGRTHQIRVHMAHLKYPVVGDPVYSGRSVTARGINTELLEMLRRFPRQALHASSLSFIHPAFATSQTFEAPLPEDMRQLLKQLQRDMDE